MHTAAGAVHHLLVLRPFVLHGLTVLRSRLPRLDPHELAPLAVSAVLGICLLSAALDWISECVEIRIVACSRMCHTRPCELACLMCSRGVAARVVRLALLPLLTSWRWPLHLALRWLCGGFANAQLRVAQLFTELLEELAVGFDILLPQTFRLARREVHKVCIRRTRS